MEVRAYRCSREVASVYSTFYKACENKSAAPRAQVCGERRLGEHCEERQLAHKGKVVHS